MTSNYSHKPVLKDMQTLLMFKCREEKSKIAFVLHYFLLLLMATQQWSEKLNIYLCKVSIPQKSAGLKGNPIS